MLPYPAANPALRRSATLLLPAGCLLLLAVCQAAPRPEHMPLPDPELESSIVRLDPAEAEQLANEIRQEVSAEPAPGLELSLWAPEQLLIDPIALDVDHQGRVYVTGTVRTRGFLDIRGHPGWMIESLSLRTPDDLRAFLHRRLAPERSEQNQWLPDINEDGLSDWRDLTVQKERVYRLVDSNGDGRADLSQVVVEDFHTEITDVAGGLLVHDGDVYVGVAPDVWRLRDRSGRGVYDTKELISHGYGTHRGFGGHGVSGVMMGPDGRIYWSVGDMGLNVVDREGRRWEYPNQGAILRSNPDGTGFEVFAAGLRNTHEFAFDEFGNLISVDNDGDHQGEQERLVYIVDGSDSGWRVNWQFGKYTDPSNNRYSVWMDERLYRPRFEGQAAYITPPLAAYNIGPAGLAYNPGTALNEQWRNHFFVSAFHGSPSNSRIHAFRLSPRGAGFELANDTVVVRGILVTGMQFGPDGALYLADWVDGWNASGSGRIWKLDAPDAAASALRSETRALLAERFDRRPEAALAALLRHPDQRVRQKAQFALVERGAERALLAAARQPEHQLARVHGLWGLAQLARRDARRAAPLAGFLQDADPEIRAQAAKMIGDVRYAAAGEALVPLTRDGSARVRFFAAEALGRIGHRAAVQPIVAMLAANDDEDVYLRHAGSLALARIGEAEPVVALADHPSRAVRVAAVVALRRMRHPGVARFVADRDEYVVAEAARAINDDQGIEEALPALAALLEQERFTGEPLLRRAISANARLGTPEAARRLAGFAARTSAAEAMRVEAIAALGVLPNPSVVDRVDGIYHGATQRDPAIAQAALAPVVAAHLEAASTPVRVALAEAAGRAGLRQAAPALLARVRTDPAPEVRVVALRALHVLQAEQMEAAVRAALQDRESSVRMTALTLIPALDLPPETTTELLASVIGRQSVQEQQSALRALGQLRNVHANRVLGGLLDRMTRGDLAAEVQLDLMEAVEASESEALIALLAQFRTARGASPMIAFGETLRGGDMTRGRQIVHQNTSAQCTRCHAFGDDGPDVGPNLRQIGAVLTREQLLESLVDPAARIPPGYGIVSLRLHSGETVAGMLREETASHLVLQTGSGERRVAHTEVAQRTNAPSSMPSMEHLLSRHQIRDVVEYLSTLRRDAQ